MKTIRASEINSFLYCQRAWRYQGSGYKSENSAELLAGEGMHERHGRSVAATRRLRLLGVILLLLSLTLFAVYLTLQLL